MAKKHFRLLPVAVIAAFLLSFVFAACGTGNQAGTSDQATQSTQAVSSGAEETTQAADLPKMTFKYFGSRNIPETKGVVTEYLEEKFNLDIEMMGAPEDQIETKLGLLLASGDMPDLFPVWNMTAIKANGLAAFGVDALKQYMPATYKMITDTAERLGRDPDLILGLNSDKNGVVNQIPQINIGAGNPRPLLWRQDMLDELGKKVPTTIQEMEDVFKAYKAKWPKQYPIAGGGKDLNWQCFTEVMDSTGGDYFMWYVKDNKIVQGAVQPEVKEALGILRDWVKEGYISPTWITMSDSEKIDEWNNGNSICINWMGVQPTDPPYLQNQATDTCAKLNPDAKFVMGPLPILHEGVKPFAHTWDEFISNSFGFGKQLEKDPDKLKRVMQLDETFFADPDVNMMLVAGVKDKHWTMDADGLLKMLPGAVTPDEMKALNIGYYNLDCVTGGVYHRTLLINQRQRDLESQWFNGPLSSDNITRGFGAIKGVLTGPNGEDFDKLYRTAFEKKRDEVFAEIINGEKPLDEFDNLVKYWNDNGGPALEEAANRLYLKFYVK